MKLNIINEIDDSQSIFYYIPNFFTDNEVDKIKSKFDDIDYIPNYNYNETKIIRYQKWYQNNNRYFCESWKTKYKRWESNPYFNELENFQTMLVKKLKKLELTNIGIHIPEFNSCLINKYLPTNYIRPHRDTDKAFGKEPVIIGISFGAPVTMLFKRVNYNGINAGLSKKDKKNEFLNFKLNLKPNSLFIMAGSSQKYWTHEILKLQGPTPRFSLTFRKQIT